MSLNFYCRYFYLKLKVIVSPPLRWICNPAETRSINLFLLVKATNIGVIDTSTGSGASSCEKREPERMIKKTSKNCFNALGFVLFCCFCSFYNLVSLFNFKNTYIILVLHWITNPNQFIALLSFIKPQDCKSSGADSLY